MASWTPLQTPVFTGVSRAGLPVRRCESPRFTCAFQGLCSGERSSAPFALKGGRKVTYEEALNALPDGAMIELDAAAYVVWKQQLLKWSFNGYEQREMLWRSIQNVRVLTPASIVRMFRKGFQPDVHESAHVY